MLRALDNDGLDRLAVRALVAGTILIALAMGASSCTLFVGGTCAESGCAAGSTCAKDGRCVVAVLGPAVDAGAERDDAGATDDDAGATSDDGGLGTDGGDVDAGAADAGDTDAGVVDAGADPSDAGALDAGSTDAGVVVDAGASDAGFAQPCGGVIGCPGDFACNAGFCRSLDRYGEGEDGVAVATGVVDLSSVSLTGRSTPDMATATVVGFEERVVTLAVDAATIVGVGDEVLLISLRGRPGDVDDVGTWETFFVDAVSGVTVTLHEAPQGNHGAPTFDTIALVRIPRYAQLAVNADAVLTTRAFQPANNDGSNAITAPVGGVMFLRVAGALVVHLGGAVDVSGLGYRGGPTGQVADEDGMQGEGQSGFGPRGDVYEDGFNRNDEASTENRGGGGCLVTGAGGGHGAAGTAGEAFTTLAGTFGVPDPPEPGGAHGDAELSRLYFGGGGGGVWRTNQPQMSQCGDGPGPGGRGGGVLWLNAQVLTLAGELAADGTSTRSSGRGTTAYGAGGGAGGAIRVLTESLELEGEIHAYGGGGWDPIGCGFSAADNHSGGDGAVGRIRIEATTVNGVDPSTFQFDLVKPPPFVP